MIDTRRSRNEDGSVLLGVMLLTVMMAAISVTMTLSGQTELLLARSDESAAQAYAAAEAGLNHAVDITLVHLGQWQSNGFTSLSDAVTALLEGPDGSTGTPATDADNGSLEDLGIPRFPATVPLAGDLGVSYEARVFDEDDPARGLTLSVDDAARIGEDGVATSDTNAAVVLRAIGRGSAGASVTLEATLGGSEVLRSFRAVGSPETGRNTAATVAIVAVTGWREVR